MKTIILMLGAMLALCSGCTTPRPSVDGKVAEDPYSGRAWHSKFEACMCEIEAPLVFHKGDAYLYNRAHNTLRHIGSYDLDDGFAVLRTYHGVKADIRCSILQDGSLSMVVGHISPEVMGLNGLIDKGLMPWRLPMIHDEKVLNRANKLIDKEKQTEPNQRLQTMRFKPPMNAIAQAPHV